MASAQAPSAPRERERAAGSSRFWKPGTIAPGVEIQRSSGSVEEAQDGLLLFNSRSHLPLADQRRALPIFARRRELLWALEQHRVLVLVGATGSGKTTQVPQYLWEAGWTARGRAVVCCQPRQVAAVAVAQRVQEEFGPRHAGLVGHRIRFEADGSSSSNEGEGEARKEILFMTDATLACETMDDPLLTRYSVVMIDECHERSLQTDLLLGLCRKILLRRPDLRLVVSSATMDAEAFRSFFETGLAVSASAPEEVRQRGRRRFAAHLPTHVMRIEGRQYPVALRYTREPVVDYVQAVVEAVLHIYRTELYPPKSSSSFSSSSSSSSSSSRKVSPGDILCFVSSPEEIARVCELLAEVEDRIPRLQVLPLHAKLSAQQQLQALRPPSERERRAQGFRCIVSTNLAETSLTIPGVAYVVDAGFVRLLVHDPRTAVSTLLTTPASQQSAEQRAGRAGRQGPGLCFRLYPEPAFARLPALTVPEICRAPLAGLLLQLKALGVDNLAGFEFCQPPPRALLAEALELLFALGCLDAEARLTAPLGRVVAEFMSMSGVAEGGPQLAKLLWSAGRPEFHCSEEMASLAALLSVKSLFVAPGSRVGQNRADACRLVFAAEQGDHLTALNVFQGYLDAGQSPKWCQQRFLDPRALRRAAELRRSMRGIMRRLGIPLLSVRDKPLEDSASSSSSSSGSAASGVTAEGLAEAKRAAVRSLQRCLASAFFMNAAQEVPGATTSWRTPRGQGGLLLHPSSVLRSAGGLSSWTSTSTATAARGRWIVFHELVHTSQTFMRDCTLIEPAWLPELAPDYFEHRAPVREHRHDPQPQQKKQKLEAGGLSFASFQQPDANDAPELLANQLGSDAPAPGGIKFRPKKHRRLF